MIDYGLSNSDTWNVVNTQDIPNLKLLTVMYENQVGVIYNRIVDLPQDLIII